MTTDVKKMVEAAINAVDVENQIFSGSQQEVEQKINEERRERQEEERNKVFFV